MIILKIRKSIESNISYEIIDKEGNVIEDISKVIGTEYILKMCTGEIYTIIVMGDINGDGEIKISELARASRLGIAQEEASEIEIMAIDIDSNGEIKVNDLAVISRLARE